MRSVEKKLIAATVYGDAKLMTSSRQAFVNRHWWEHFRGQGTPPQTAGG
jgi:hypothetical protein